MSQLTVSVPGTIGTNTGPGSDGVLAGYLAPTALAKGLLEYHAISCLCLVDDGGVFTDETTPANESTGDDVEVPATIAVDDALYIGHATKTFVRTDINITTQGDYTDLTVTWQYWDGDSWEALTGVTDGTTAWTAATGIKSVTFTLPGDWAANTAANGPDGTAGYFIRGVAGDGGSLATTTAMQAGQIWVVANSGEAEFVDDTTDINDAGAGDVALLPATDPVLNDAFYFSHATEQFPKVKLTTSQAATGTHTFTWEYWNGSAWSALTVLEDKSAGYSATAGTHMVSFAPPSDWTANTTANGPNSQAGYFIRCRLSAITSVTQQPLATQAWVYPVVTGAKGILITYDMNGQDTVSMDAFSAVSATNNDSIFLVIDCTSGSTEAVTWTGGEKTDSATLSTFRGPSNDELVIAQIQEDGTTEFAGVTFYIGD